MKNKRQLLKYRGTTCLNCYHPLDRSEIYCHHCGQLNSTKRLTFEDFFNEFFSGIFAYDSRLYRTLRALLFRPGKISKDYIEGKRQRYANPYKFYLSVSIIFFIFWGMTTDLGVEGIPPGAAEEMNMNLDSIPESQVVEFREVLIDGDSIKSNQVLDLLVGDQRDQTLEEMKVPETVLDTIGFWNATEKKIRIFTKYFRETDVTHPRTALEELGYSQTFYNRWLYDKVADLQDFHAEAFIRYLLGKLPFIIFFFLPIFALFIWLLYVRRSYTYMEHLIFTFHNQTVLFVLFGIGFAMNQIFDTSWGSTLASLGFLLYLYKAMRYFYRQGRVKTFLKFLILNGLFFILAIVATVFSVLASFAIF